MNKEKVSIISCDTYEEQKVRRGILKGFEDLGGIEKYIDKGDKVLLKINLLMKKKPEEATTTHPIFTKILAEILIAYGAEVVIGDSPAGPFNERMLKGVYRACGIEQIADEVGAKLNYNTNIMEIKNEDGRILKHLTATEMLKDVDKVISVSKLKTHSMALFTGAVKNMFGIVPGLEKAEYHYKMSKIEDFSNALVDICLAAKPVLSFMDGIVGMEGAGPSAGTPRQVGVILASTSPYHLDVAATKVIGIEPAKVPTIKRCIERGLCGGSFEDIELYGEPIEQYIIDDFKVPKIRSLNLLGDRMPKFLRDIVNGLLQPSPTFDHDMCVGCGDCAESCPPKIINMVDRKPEVDLEECIRCFCCQELCPKKAVDIHRPWLMSKLSKF